MKRTYSILIPLLFAITLRIIFGASILDDFISVMSITFFLAVPAGVGALTIYFSNSEKVKSWSYRFFMPWIPVLLVIAVTMLLMIEGWACWLMIAPFFLLASSVGGLIAGYFKLRKNKKQQNINLSIVLLLPFFIGPIENALPRSPEIFTTYTSIIINADAPKIWKNVTSVKTISKNEDSSKLISWLGFPKPVKAELDTLAVGGFRKAIFEKGLVFNETVTKYENLKLMEFQIKANTFEIPSTTLDEHILIGGEYFDMLNGTYQLQKISNNQYKLMLYSHFSMNTTFNFYAGIWGNWIMKDIQNNILKVIKNRSEKHD
ncbi:MAG: hypothetical protein PSV16_10480 [Flavobacterium sp.]|nr:hypothetical protein [Flavobacterium sp.]